MIPHPSWIEIVAPDQDWAWFLVLALWSVALIAWWRHPQRHQGWAWVPWTAPAAALGALAHFVIFNPPFPSLHTRTLQNTGGPGGFTLVEPVIKPELLTDLVIGGVQALAMGGWVWLALRQRRVRGAGWIAAAMALALAFVHRTSPVTATSIVSVAQLAAAIVLWRTVPAGRLTRAAFVLAALIPALSPVGPLAGLTDGPLRDGPPTPVGLVAASLQTTAAVLACLGLARGALNISEASLLRTVWREDRGLVIAMMCWLAVGLGWAVQAGQQSRRDILQAHLRGAEQRAKAIHTPILGALANATIRLERIQPPTEDRIGQADAPFLGGAIGTAIVRELDRRGPPPPFTHRAGFVFISDGWLVRFPGSSHRYVVGSTHVDVLRPATERDRDDWRHARGVIEPSPIEELGRDLALRAPVIDAEGRMLAWFEHARFEIVSTLPRRPRAILLLTTAMGVIVGATLLLQRRGARERQAALHAAEVAADANRVKTAFLAKVSHELRTPIQSLLGYSELLRERVAGDARAEAWLSAVQQHGQLLTRLVNDLIDLAAVEAGTFRLAPRTVAPVELVRSTVETLRPQAEAKGLALDCEFAGDIPPWLKLDAERVRQVVLNLVANAVKFTDEGGVTVTFRAISADATRATLAFVVQDTGPGIRPADQVRLFDAFARLDLTSHKAGSGLGLALTSALCRAMNGTVSVRSDGTAGACFTATFCAEIATEPAPAIAAVAPSLRGRSVLVVDDNPLVRELFVTSLGSFGARCRGAATAAAALADAAVERPEVVVLDLALPDQHGTELAPRLREAWPDVRIVGVSAHAGSGERDDALAAGMDAFLAKPVALDELAAAVAGAPCESPLTPDQRQEMQDHLAGQFRLDAPEKFAALGAAIAAGDWRRTRALAHYLANSAAVLHDEPLLEACVALARAAEAGDGATVRAIAPQCESAMAPWLLPSPHAHARSAD